MIHVKRVIHIVPVFLFIFTQVVILSTISLYISGQWKEEFQFADDIVVAGVHLGGLTEKDARDRLHQTIQKINNKTLEVTMDGKTYPINKSTVGIMYDIDRTILEAKRTSEELSGMIGMWKKWRDTAPSPIVPLQFTYNRQSLIEQINQIGENVNRSAIPATGKVQGKSIVIVPEVEGYRVNTEKTLLAIEEELKYYQRHLRIPLAVEKDMPQVIKQDLKNIRVLLAEQNSGIQISLPNQLVNVQEIANRLNGTIVFPDKIFSFNEKIAKLLPQDTDTFSPSLASEDGALSKAASQVASLLYVAAIKSHLPIVERHHHERPVAYAAAGLDAFVDGKELDLRFANRLKEPIYVHASVANNQLRVAIFGAPSDKGEVHIEVKQKEIYKPDTVVRFDESLAKGQEKIVSHGKEGIRVKMIASWREKDGTIKTEALSDDYYPPVPSVVAVGPEREWEKDQAVNIQTLEQSVQPPSAPDEAQASDSNKTIENKEAPKQEESVIYLP
jgi:vancomycin resistance protein YoaR